MYEELVKALRCRDAERGYYTKCEYYGEASDNFCVRCDSDRLTRDAAAAIEELQAELTRISQELPKRGEWIDGEHFEDPYLGRYCCSVCGNAVQAIEFNAEQNTVRFTSGKSNYCPNCGAKMEVQE